MIKQTLTPERVQNIQQSIAIITVMSKAIQMEYCMDLMDTKFKSPQVNMFAGRIGKDVKEIYNHLKNNYRVSFELIDTDLLDEYAAEMQRIIHLFMKLPLSQIREVMDNLCELLVAVEGE